MIMESKIELTLDNVQFRFKTQEELFEEFGGLNSNCLGFGWNLLGEMDYLFGSIIPSNWNVEFFKLVMDVIDHIYYPKFGEKYPTMETWFIKKSVITYKLLNK